MSPRLPGHAANVPSVSDEKVAAITSQLPVSLTDEQVKTITRLLDNYLTNASGYKQAPRLAAVKKYLGEVETLASRLADKLSDLGGHPDRMAAANQMLNSSTLPPERFTSFVRDAIDISHAA